MVSTITLWKLRPKVEAERGPAPLKPVVVYDDGLFLRFQKHTELRSIYSNGRIHPCMHHRNAVKPKLRHVSPPRRASGGSSISSIATSCLCSPRRCRFRLEYSATASDPFIFCIWPCILSAFCRSCARQFPLSDCSNMHILLHIHIIGRWTDVGYALSNIV
jgi:hypothetical protein